jgi:DNA-directed RNA polymerase alpha subunit
VRNLVLTTGDPVRRLWEPGGPAVATQARNCLVRSGILTVADLLKCDARDLQDLRNFGAGCLEEVRRALRRHGLALHGEDAGD